jgi:hypothetical protein
MEGWEGRKTQESLFFGIKIILWKGTIKGLREIGSYGKILK